MTTGSMETNPSQDERLSHLESQIDNLREMMSGLVKILNEKKSKKASIKAKIKDGNLEIPHIKMTFPMPAEVLNQSIVAMVSSSIVKAGEWITTDDSGRALGNWEFEDNFSFIILE